MRTKDALTIVALALLMLHTTARAETIDECQELAKQNYPLIKRYDLISQTARYTESVIKKEWLPQIEFYAQLWDGQWLLGVSIRTNCPVSHTYGSFFIKSRASSRQNIRGIGS